MENSATVVLSALCLGVALSGAASSMRLPMERGVRRPLLIVYGCFAGLVALPLVASVFPVLFLWFLPAALVMLLVLPVAICRYVAARVDGTALVSIHWASAVFPIIGAVVALGYWWLPLDVRRAMFVDGALPDGTLPLVLALTTFALIICWQAIAIWCLVATLKHLRVYRARLKQLYSNTTQHDLRWIDVFVAVLVAIWAMAALYVAAENFGVGFRVPHQMVLVAAACMLLFFNAFALEPRQPDAPAPPADFQDVDVEKYARSALTKEHAQQIAQRIEKAMQRDQLYLDPNLSLKKLSQHVSARSNMVSQTLNEQIGETFFDYVARWRIAASKPMIEEGKLSVLAIAFEVGFNSRSTFYKAFKRETGLTPQAYRDSVADQG